MTYVVKKKHVVSSIMAMMAQMDSIARMVQDLPGTGLVTTLGPKPALPIPWVGHPCGPIDSPVAFATGALSESSGAADIRAIKPLLAAVARDLNAMNKAFKEFGGVKGR